MKGYSREDMISNQDKNYRHLQSDRSVKNVLMNESDRLPIQILLHQQRRKRARETKEEMELKFIKVYFLSNP
jgi:hypothetical protein